MKQVLFLPLAIISLSMAPQIAGTQSSSASPEVASPSAQPARTVKGQILTSTSTPAVRLEFDKSFKYAGSQTFILYDVATAEQHFFVDADSKGRIKRFYWVQFEGYLPNNTHTYKYKVNKTVNIGGLDFIADAYPRNIKVDPGRAGSDGGRAREFLSSKGYRMRSDDLLSQRLVYMVDQEKRNELMIIYIEDLSETGLTAADLSPGGRAAGGWDDIARGLLERAMNNMKLTH